ncbi:hypothetical protein BC833DRAFT_653245 [Globomyces pollinis-pini]|nr:hypothetical protein BC833DRAFT_653245 [Globomyces pollinis-pini]
MDTTPSFDTSESLGEYSNTVLGSILLEKSSIPNSPFQMNFNAKLLSAFPMIHFEHDRFVVPLPVENAQNISLAFKVDNKHVQGFVFRGDGFTDDIKDGLYFTKL